MTDRIGGCHRLRLEHGLSLTCHWRYWAIYKYNQWQAKNVEGFSAITVLNEQQELTNRINAGWEQGHARPYPMRPQNTDDTLDSRHRPIWQMEVSCGRHQMEDQ